MVTSKRSSINAKFLWTTGGYAVSLVVRFASNVMLARLLGPDILGIMVIAQAVRVGTELLTDVGMEQNVVNSPNGNEPTFLNTAWTLQIGRGLMIGCVLVALSPFLASFYKLPVGVFFAMSAAPLVNSLASTSIFTLSKNLQVKTRSLFELASEGAGLVINVGLALAMPNMWAPILGVLFGLAARAALSYRLPHPPHRLVLDRAYARSIIGFGKWIMLSSLAFYAAMYIDRLFLGKAVSIAQLGIYGLARSISDLPMILAGRLAFQIVFPVIAANRDGSALERRDLSSSRLRFLLVAALGIGTVMAWSDWAIRILYDSRYDDAGWMLFLLLIGCWVGVLAALAEATVLGFGRPHFVSIANISRVVVMAAAMPIGFAMWGIAGAILALPAGEFIRYITLQLMQRRHGLADGLQDGFATLALCAALGVWAAIRWILGLQLPWTFLAWQF